MPLLLLGALLAVAQPSLAASSDIAATVNGQAIFIRDIDAQSVVQITKLREEIGVLLARTVDRLIDERLRSLTPPETVAELSQLPVASSVTDEEARSYRAAHEKDVAGTSPVEGTESESEEQAAILRSYLEQKTREAADMQLRQRLRQGHVIRLSLPSPQELEVPVTQERQIAQVDNTWIRAVEFERAAAWRLYQLRGEIYRERLRNLAPAIDNILLDGEARRRGITTEALFAELSAQESVSEEEVQAFLAAEQEAGRPVPTAERAQVYLEFRKAYDRRQALLKKLQQETPVKILLKEPAIPHFPVVDTGVTVLGAKRGKRLVVYTNYHCPTCRSAQQEIDTLLAQDKRVRVIFHDFIPGHDPVATEAAYLARCAAQWGVFPRMHKELLTREPPTFGQHWYKEAELPQLLRKLRVRKKAEFLECLGTDVYKAIEGDTANARELGFEDPPVFVAEGILLAGTPSAESVVQAFARGLKMQSQRKQGEEDDSPPRRWRGRRGFRTERIVEPRPYRSRRALRPARKREVITEDPSPSRTTSQSLQKPKPMPQSPATKKKSAPKARRQRLFDLE